MLTGCAVGVFLGGRVLRELGEPGLEEAVPEL